MTPAQFKEAQQTLGLSDVALSRILDVDENTIRRWKRDPSYRTARAPHPTAARVMEWLLAGYRPKNWPKET